MWAFVDSERDSRVVCHDICTFFVLASLTAMSIVCPPGWFMRCIPSRSSFITFPLSILWLQSGRAWCLLVEGMVDNSVLPAISPESWRSCARVSGYEGAIESPTWKKQLAALQLTSQNSSVFCVCVHMYAMCMVHTLHHFLRAD